MLIDTAAQSSVITKQTVDKMKVKTHKLNNNKKRVLNGFNDLNSTDTNTIAELTIGKREDNSVVQF
jgi:Aspartyl protease